MNDWSGKPKIKINVLKCLQNWYIFIEFYFKIAEVTKNASYKRAQQQQQQTSIKCYTQFLSAIPHFSELKPRSQGPSPPPLPAHSHSSRLCALYSRTYTTPSATTTITASSTTTTTTAESNCLKSTPQSRINSLGSRNGVLECGESTSMKKAPGIPSFLFGLS